MPKTLKKAVGYLRTSSATNVEGDSEKRQQEAIHAYAKAYGYEVVISAWDEAVSGTDPVRSRQGMSALIKYCEEHSIDTIICERADRFSRDVVVQELGFQDLKSLGIHIIPADAPNYFSDGSPSMKMIRQILGVIAEYQKDSTVQQLKVARDRVKAETGKCEGRKSLEERYGRRIFTRAKKLRKQGKGSKLLLSYRDIASALFHEGFSQESGKPLAAPQIKRLLEG